MKSKVQLIAPALKEARINGDVEPPKDTIPKFIDNSVVYVDTDDSKKRKELQQKLASVSSLAELKEFIKEIIK